MSFVFPSSASLALPPLFASLAHLQAAGITLRGLIQSVDDILPSLHSSVTTEVSVSSPAGALKIKKR